MEMTFQTTRRLISTMLAIREFPVSREDEGLHGDDASVQQFRMQWPGGGGLLPRSQASRECTTIPKGFNGMGS